MWNYPWAAIPISKKFKQIPAVYKVIPQTGKRVFVSDLGREAPRFCYFHVYAFVESVVGQCTWSRAMFVSKE